MSEHTSHSNAHPKTDGPGYETRDVEVKPITKFMFGLVGLMVLGGILGFISFKLLEFRENMTYADMKATKLQETRTIPPGPLLQVSNHDDLIDYRVDQAKDVDGHATWLDKNAKVVRLPIARAIELVSERGLPVFQSSAAPAGDKATAEGKK